MHGSIDIREDYSARDLRKLARQEDKGRVALRLTAIAAVLEGASWKDAAARSGMDRQTLCDWVHRFNEKGPAGLRDAPCGHPKKRLTATQEAAVKAHVLNPRRTGLSAGAAWISSAGSKRNTRCTITSGQSASCSMP